MIKMKEISKQHSSRSTSWPGTNIRECVLEKLLVLSEYHATFRMLPLAVSFRHHGTCCMNFRWLAALCATFFGGIAHLCEMINMFILTILNSWVIYYFYLIALRLFSAQSSRMPSSVVLKILCLIPIKNHIKPLCNHSAATSYCFYGTAKFLDTLAHQKCESHWQLQHLQDLNTLNTLVSGRETMQMHLSSTLNLRPSCHRLLEDTKISH